MHGHEPTPLPSRKRLKSLDEFEPPSWLGQLAFGEKKARLWPIVIIGLALGAAIGWFLVPVF